MIKIHTAEERGSTQLPWLQGKHSFSFGRYYNPARLGFSTLKVINEDTVAPGAGFDTHPHRDMEIISYVLSGSIKHKDSLGNEFIVNEGDVQIMSAGTGIAHSEYNNSQHEPLHFLQIWVEPDTTGLTPSYQQANIAQNTMLTPLVTPNGEGQSLSIHQDTSLHRLQLTQGQHFNLHEPGRATYIHIVKGQAAIAEYTVNTGDALSIETGEPLKITALSASAELLLFDLPLPAE